MELSLYIFSCFELLGTVAFALSGAMVAIEKKADIFGVLVLGIITATGGGMLRDVLLGKLPPRLFSNSLYVAVAAVTALLLFLLARRYRSSYIRKAKTVDQINNFFDALGLGAFTITGIQIGLSSGFAQSYFFLVFLGVLTGVGGGLIRDLMVMEIPFVLRKRVYAIAAILGGLVYVFVRSMFPAGELIASLLSIFTTVAIRLLATYFRWHLPRALP